MKVILLNGSAHSNGSTYRALSQLAKTLEENDIDIKLIQIGTDTIRGCIGCGKCKEIGKCVFDDVVNELVDLVSNSDGFVVGSPVYYGSANGSLISLLDRMFYSSDEKFYNKIAASIVVARRAGTTASIDQINKYFASKQMPIITSTYWNMVYGNNEKEVLFDEEGIETIYNLAINMVWILKCVENGKNIGINPPMRKKTKRTNFIR